SELTALGFNDVIGKPVDASLLYQCLQNYLTSTHKSIATKISNSVDKEPNTPTSITRYLLVEDDADAAQITQLLLESLGVETAIADSFEQCTI
ncbi:hypothetical protein ACKI1O_49275, partial [Streptomyces scabiei]